MPKSRRAAALTATWLSALTLGIITGGQAATRVSVELSGETLAEGIPTLGEAAGERQRCGPNAADRRIVLLVDGQPLREVMEQLQRFVPAPPGKARWFREGSGTTFDEDLASRQARRRAGERRRRFSESQRRQGLAGMRRWTEARPDDSRNVAACRKRIREDLQVFGGLPAVARKQALSGRPVLVPFGGLGSAEQFLLRERFKHEGSFRENDRANGFYGAKDAGKIIVEVVPTGCPERPGLQMRYWLSSAGGDVLSDILNPPIWNPKLGWDWSHHHKQYRERDRGPKNRAEVPALQRPISLTGGPESTIDAVLKEICSLTSLPLVGEYDPCFSNPHQRGENGRKNLEKDKVEKLPLWQALDVVATRFDLDWEYGNGWLRIRSPRTLLSWAGEVDLSPPTERDVHRGYPGGRQ